MIAPRQHSVPAGDLVLTVLPPFFRENWLNAGVVRLSHLLRCNGVTPRVVRVHEHDRTPETVRVSAHRAMVLDTPMAARLEALQAEDDWLESMVDELLRGPEAVFAFSTWNCNADVTVEVCRRIKARRPEATFFLGGPEAIERSETLRHPWIDAVVTSGGDDVVVPLASAFLDGQPGRARRLPHTWVADRHVDDKGPLAETKTPDDAVDFTDLVPLVLLDPAPRLPTVLNVGCVFDCGFCTNRLIYPKVGWGSVEAAVEEIARITAHWAEYWPDPDARPRLAVEIADATLNGWPDQFDNFCKSLSARSLALKPLLGGNIVFDKRITEERWENTRAAGITDLFFGLESASDRIRKEMKKPGRIATVWEALQIAERAGQGETHVGFGVIVGWPSETEADYQQTVAFLEKVSALEGLTPNANVTPLFRTPNAQNPELMGSLGGAERGAMWRSDDPAGDPAVRARRMMGLVERFHGVMRVSCPMPTHNLAKFMLPESAHPFLERWAAIHEWPEGPAPARPTEPVVEEPRAEASAPAEPVPPPPAPEPQPAEDPTIGRERLTRLFEIPASAGEIRVESSIGMSRVIVREPGEDGIQLTLVVKPRDEGGHCYRQTETLDISLQGSQFPPSAFALVDRLLDQVAERERA